MAATAALVLSALYFFDEFDTAAFGTLAPDIQHTFHLTDKKFVGLVVLNVTLVLLLAIPIGHLADRVRRTPLVVLSGILAGVFSFATGLVGTVGLLTVARFGNGLGLLANGPVHNSLLADYYRPEERGEAYAYHLNAMYIGAVIGPMVAGICGSLFGWRWAFLILLFPIIAVSLVALRLTEPLRGATDDPESAADAVDDRATFREGVRTLWSIRTLRRQFWGALFFGAGLIPLLAYLALYLQRVYHLSPFWRGAIGSADAAATFVGIQLAGRWTAGWFTKGMGEPLRRAALSLAIVGGALVLLAVSPFLALSIGILLGASFIIGVFQPPFYAVQALVSPARARTLSFSFGALFLVAGVAAFFVSPLGSVSDDHGIRWGIAVLTPFWMIAAAYMASAAPLVNDDAVRALNSLAEAAERRRLDRENRGVRDVDG